MEKYSNILYYINCLYICIVLVCDFALKFYIEHVYINIIISYILKHVIFFRLNFDFKNIIKF